MPRLVTAGRGLRPRQGADRRVRSSELEDATAYSRRASASTTRCSSLRSRIGLSCRFAGTLFPREKRTSPLAGTRRSCARGRARRLMAGRWSVTVVRRGALEARTRRIGPLYLERRLAAGEEAARVAQRLDERAAPGTNVSCRTRPRCAQLATRMRRAALEAAYLVRKERQGEFDAAVPRCAGRARGRLRASADRAVASVQLRHERAAMSLETVAFSTCSIGCWTRVSAAGDVTLAVAGSISFTCTSRHARVGGRDGATTGRWHDAGSPRRRRRRPPAELPERIDADRRTSGGLDSRLVVSTCCAR